MAVEKRYFSWQTIHKQIQQLSERVHEWNPTTLVCILGGGAIPARLLRTCLKSKTSKNVPMQAITLQLYDDDDHRGHEVQRLQWLSPDFNPSGQRILLIDEVDDSRTTLSFAVEEMLRYFEEKRAEHAAQRRGGDPEWVQPALGVFVVHNKLRTKAAAISPAVMDAGAYFAIDTPNRWHVYPWDASEPDLHHVLANQQDEQEGAAARGTGMAIPGRARTSYTGSAFVGSAGAHGGSGVCSPAGSLVGSPVSGVLRSGSLTRQGLLSTSIPRVGSFGPLPRVGSNHRLEVTAE